MSEKKKKRKLSKEGQKRVDNTINKTENNTKKKNGSFVNIILFLILLVGLAWLGYTNGVFDKYKTQTGTFKTETQVEKFINDNGKTLFSKAKFEVKSTEKKDGIWRSILDINGQPQDFYITTDGQVIIGTETVSKIMQSDKEETIGDVDEKGNIKINDNLKDKIQKFVEEKLVQPGTKVEVTKIAKDHGLIKITIKTPEQEQDLYITPNGKRLVFGVVSMDEIKKQIDAQEKAQEKASRVDEKNKNDKPVVEYFVMSYCPYGTQFEKGIIPVIKLLGDKIDAKLKFVDYAMHNKKELDENLAQYCIQKEQKEKLYPYLECFLASDGQKAGIEKCLASTGVDKNKLNNCIAITDKEFKVSENYKDKATWKGQFPTFNIDKSDNEKYGVGGSPTLIINEQKIQPNGRDAQNLLEAICSGFKNPPAECQQKLSSKQPSSGFGTGKASSNSSGGGCAQ